VKNSEKRLGIKNPGSADVELSVNKNTTILGIKHPESADVEISVNKNTNILGIKNPECADVEIYVNKNTNILGVKNPESVDEVNTVKNRINKNRLKSKNFKPAVVELSDKQQINKIGTDPLDGLKEKIVHYIEKEHSKINMEIPFRTDINGEINLIHDRPIYGKQYPYFVNSEISRMLAEEIIRPSRSPYNSPVLVVPKKRENQDGSRKLRLVIDYKKLNESTIPDRYPMQDPSVILPNLGKERNF